MFEVGSGGEFGDAPAGELAEEGAAELFAVAVADGAEFAVLEVGAFGIDEFEAAFAAEETAGGEFPASAGALLDLGDGEGGGAFGVPGVEFEESAALVDLDLAALEAHGFGAGFEQQGFGGEEGGELGEGKHQ